jgi:hypothetical protein
MSRRVGRSSYGNGLKNRGLLAAVGERGPHPPPLQLALFANCTSPNVKILKDGGTLMASPTMAEFIAFLEEQKKQFQADIDTVDKALEMLRRLSGTTTDKANVAHGNGRRTYETPIRDLVLDMVGSQPTFRLAPLIDAIIKDGKMAGTKRAIYGSVTGMLRRNGHIFKKVRRGIYRIVQRPIIPKLESNEQSDNENQQQAETAIH